MSAPLKLLLVEDSDSDAELLIHALKRAGLNVVWKQAQSAAELRELLAQESWDALIADFALPQFSAMAALMIIRERELDIPFIVVSGVVGEETAVEAMRAGAHDFVTKHNLARLAPVVEREVRGARERKAWKAAVEASPPAEEDTTHLSPSRWEWFLPLASATSLTLLVTVGIELLQEIFFAGMPPGKAALVVVLVAGPVAAASIYYLLSKRRALMQKIIAEFVERRRLNEMSHRLAERTRELEAKIEERQRRERHLKAQHAITRIMAGTDPFEEALPSLLQSLCTVLLWDVGVFWSQNTPDGDLEIAARYPQALAAHSAETTPLLFDRLAHHARDSRKPLWIQPLNDPAIAPPDIQGLKTFYRTALAFPIRLGQDFLGVMVFLTTESRTADRELLELLEDIGNQIGQFIERRRAETELQKAHEDLELRVRKRTAELANLNDALSRSENNLRQAQQIAHLGSFEAYTPFHLSLGNYWSDEACRILGLDPTRTNLSLESFLNELVHPEDRTRIQQELSRLEEGRSPFELEHQIVRLGEAPRFVRMQAEPCFDEQGRLFKLIGTIHDVTERKQLEQQVLEVSENEQRRIGQDLHDDLCQHLAGIEFMSHALQHRLEHEGHREAELARQVADLVRGSINQTRGLARGLSPVQLESRGLTAALQDLAAHVQHVFHINCQLAADPLVEVRNVTVATHLYRIAQEAINNAIRHGKADRIDIELRNGPNFAQLRVRDNGGGFDTAPSVEPKGMGLRIMHYRAGMIGASLQVASRSPRGVMVECNFKSEV
ncbi:MAG: response regulator [Verrucomicrobiales bacterium]|nr:response regulator [Verrucomicrobiales bacterium]